MQNGCTTVAECVEKFRSGSTFQDPLTHTRWDYIGDEPNGEVLVQYTTYSGHRRKVSWSQGRMESEFRHIFEHDESFRKLNDVMADLVHSSVLSNLKHATRRYLDTNDETVFQDAERFPFCRGFEALLLTALAGDREAVRQWAYTDHAENPPIRDRT